MNPKMNLDDKGGNLIDSTPIASPWSPLRGAIRAIRDDGIGSAVIKARARLQLSTDALVAAAVLRIRTRRGRCMSVEDSLDFAFNFAIGKAAIRPAQIRSEIAALLHLLTANPPRRILEIGTAGGGTMFLLSRVATMDARLMSIDLPGSKFGAGYGPEWIPLLRALPQKNQDLRLVRTDSHDLR